MLTLLGLVVGFMGVFGLLACIGGLIFSLVTKKGKIGWVIGLVICVLLIPVGLFIIGTSLPDDDPPAQKSDQKQEDKQQESQKEDNKQPSKENNKDTVEDNSPPETSNENESDEQDIYTAPEPITYSGRGDDVITLDPFDGVFVFHIIGNDAERHFAVKGFDSNGETTGLFVNTTSVYEGTTMDPDQETVMLEVNATGDWTIEVQSIYTMETISSGETLTGVGDSVVLVSSHGNTAVISGNASGRHFAVKSYGKDRDKLLVNTTDVYEGTVMLTGDPTMLLIDAEGAWSITFE